MLVLVAACVSLVSGGSGLYGLVISEAAGICLTFKEDWKSLAFTKYEEAFENCGGNAMIHPIQKKAFVAEQDCEADYGYAPTMVDCTGGDIVKCQCYEKVASTTIECGCLCKNQWSGMDCDVCPGDFGGADCETCAPGRVGYPLCQACTSAAHCNGRGVATANAAQTGCECACGNNWLGDRCQTCPSGYDAACLGCTAGYVPDGPSASCRTPPCCRECTIALDCSNNAVFATSAVLPSSGKLSCQCRCSERWTGEKCDVCPSRFLQELGHCIKCADHHYGVDCELCTDSYCYDRGTAKVADNQCKCECTVGRFRGLRCEECPALYGGQKCDVCNPDVIPKRFNYPTCGPCDANTCSGHGEVTGVTSSRCVCTCKNMWTDDHCKTCPAKYDALQDCGQCAPGRINYPVCEECDNYKHCNSRSLVPIQANANRNLCECKCIHQYDDAFCGTCPVNFSGVACDECAPGHVGYIEGDPHSCMECTNEVHCAGHADIVTTDVNKTRCMCKCRNEWDGDHCTTCEEKFDVAADCSKCAVGRVRHPVCSLCTNLTDCNNRASAVLTDGNQTRCICQCMNQWTGDSCAECPIQYDAAEGCGKCAEHYFDNSTDPNVLDCVAVRPNSMRLQVMGSFKSFNKSIEPPIQVQLLDDNDRIMQSKVNSQSKLRCTCQLLECEELTAETMDPLWTEHAFGTSSDPGTLLCAGPDSCPEETRFHDPACRVVSNSTSDIMKNGCECALTPQPHEAEREAAARLSATLEGKGRRNEIMLFAPRRYRVVVSLEPLQVPAGDVVALRPLVLNLPQPQCTDKSRLAVMQPSDEPFCIKCPLGLTCNGTINTWTKPGFWRSSPEILVARECPFPNCEGTSVNASSVNGCASGTSGSFCGSCRENQRVTPSGCVTCPSKSVSILIALAFLAVLVCGVLGLVRASLPTTIRRPDPVPQYIKILLSVIQVLAVLNHVEIKWDDYLEGLFVFSATAGAAAGDPRFLVCLMPPEVTLKDRVWVWVFFPIFMCCEAYLASLVFAVKRRHRLGTVDKAVRRVKEACFGKRPRSGKAKRGISGAALRATEIIASCSMCKSEWADLHCPMCQADLCPRCSIVCESRGHEVDDEVSVAHEGTAIDLPKRQVFSTAIVILMHFSFTILIDQLTQPFICRDYLLPDGATQAVTISDPRVVCDWGSLLFYMSLTFFFIYGVGIPLGLAALLTWEKANLSTQRCVASYGFLYVNYRKPYYYWECIVLLRKFLIVVAISLPQTAYAKVFAATWVLFVALVLNLLCQPYRARGQQKLDSLGMFGGACLLLAALWISTHDELELDVNSGVHSAIIVVAAFFNTVAIALTGIVVFVLLMRRYICTKERRPASPTKSDTEVELLEFEAESDEPCDLPADEPSEMTEMLDATQTATRTPTEGSEPVFLTPRSTEPTVKRIRDPLVTAFNSPRLGESSTRSMQLTHNDKPDQGLEGSDSEPESVAVSVGLSSSAIAPPRPRQKKAPVNVSAFVRKKTVPTRLSSLSSFGSMTDLPTPSLQPLASTSNLLSVNTDGPLGRSHGAARSRIPIGGDVPNRDTVCPVDPADLDVSVTRSLEGPRTRQAPALTSLLASEPRGVRSAVPYAPREPSLASSLLASPVGRTPLLGQSILGVRLAQTSPNGSSVANSASTGSPNQVPSPVSHVLL